MSLLAPKKGGEYIYSIVYSKAPIYKYMYIDILCINTKTYMVSYIE